MLANQHRPFAKVQPITPNQARFTGGFLAQLSQSCRAVMVPVMGKLMTEMERVRYVGNFEVAAGTVEGRHRGPKWNDGDFFKWLEAASAACGFAEDDALSQQLDEIIALIASAQDDDGYLHTDVQIAQSAGEDKKRFGNPLDFEMYNHGHLISAACVHFNATGKRNLLDLAIKAADFLDREFANPQPHQARHGICPAHLMALPDLYRITGEKKYLDLAVRLLDMRDLVTAGDDDNQDRIPFRKQTTAHGHAVRATYLYAGAADVFSETGDHSIYAPLEPIWNDLVNTKLYITGGCGALYDGASPDGAVDQSKITRVHQAFGRPYQLPHSTAHNETCAAIGSMFWNWRMFLITGEAKYVDLLEHTFYNSVLAGISLDGTAFFYTNTLRQLNEMPCELRWPRHREKFFSCFCCPPNVVRVIARLNEYAYARTDDAVFVTLFSNSTFVTKLGDRAIKLTQTTEYPWDGVVRIKIDETAGEWTLNVRIPGWVRGAAVSINGTPTAVPGHGGFYSMNRTWNVGDEVTLNLPMPVTFMEAHPLVEETRNHLAVMRGPIVYCLESMDLPTGVGVMDVGISRYDELAPRRDANVLSGVVTLHGKASVLPKTVHAGPLYQPAATAPAKKVDVALVPYFAWDNRGAGEMTVWLPAVG